MPRYFNLTSLERFRHRNRIRIGAGTHIDRRALFSITNNSHIHIGAKCNIGPGVVISTHGGTIDIGDAVTVNPYTVLYGHGGLRIGNHVSIAAHCTFVPANHNFDRLDVLIRDQGLSKRGIVVGNNVWVAANCTLLDGVRLGDGCVIAAGAVVCSDVEPDGVYGGVPARRLRLRGAARTADGEAIAEVIPGDMVKGVEHAGQ